MAIHFTQSNKNTFYVSNSTGNDSNSGTSPSKPWKTLAKVSTTVFLPGSRVLLKSGDVWIGETLTLKGQGTAKNPIRLSCYGNGNKPAIQPAITDEACIKLIGNSGWHISHLDLSKAKDGIRASYDQVYNQDYLWIENCSFHDLDNTYNSKADFYNHWSCGVLVEAYSPDDKSKVLKVALSHLTIKSCTFNNCNFGVQAVGGIPSHCNGYGFVTGELVQMRYFTIQDCIANNMNLVGLSLICTSNGTITNFDTNNTGMGVNHVGNAAIIAGRSANLIFDGCDINNSYRGPYIYPPINMHIDGDGFDFEGGAAPDGTGPQHDITYKNATINYTEGAGIFVYDNGGSSPSINCVIDRVTINRFGQSAGNINEGIRFTAGTTGMVSNVSLNRNAAGRASYFRGGDYSGFIFTNYLENNIP